VRVFSVRQPETFLVEEYAVALHGQSFRQRDITENLVPAYPPPAAGCFNIGVLHTGLGGMGGHVKYAPCAIEDLVNKGYDYWALAHVHQAALLHERPHVAFCGNLQGRHIRESGPKGASLVAVEDGQVENISPLNVDVVRWTHLPVPVDQCGTPADAIDQIRQTIEDVVARDSGGRLLACRIELTGRTALHGELLASTDHLLAEARAAALALGEEAAWIERLVISTSSPETAASRKDALGDLQRMIGSAAQDAGLQAQLTSDLADLIRKMPHDVRADAEDAVLKAAIDGDTASLMAYAGGYLTARLSAEKV
jgi:exonuclease SbcD